MNAEDVVGDVSPRQDVIDILRKTLQHSNKCSSHHLRILSGLEVEKEEAHYHKTKRFQLFTSLKTSQQNFNYRQTINCRTSGSKGIEFCSYSQLGLIEAPGTM